MGTCFNNCRDQKRGSQTLTIDAQLLLSIQNQEIDQYLKVSDKHLEHHNNQSVEIVQNYNERNDLQETTARNQNIKSTQQISDDQDFICNQLEQNNILEQLIRKVPLDQLELEDSKAQQIFQQSDEKLKLLFCQNFIERMHFNETEFPMVYKKLLTFTKRLVQLVYKHLEQGIRGLVLSKGEIQDKNIASEILYQLIKIQHILEQIKLNPEIDEVWWVKENDLKFDESVVDNESVYLFDLEQDMIKLSGKLKREISMNHQDVHKSSMFKYRAENTRAKLKQLEEGESEQQQ